MKWFLFLFMSLSILSGCTTCPANDEITEVIATAFKGYAYCGKYENMKMDIKPQVEKQDFCGDKFDTSKIIQTLPSGAWTAKGMCCYAVLRGYWKDHLEHGLPDWGCKVVVGKNIEKESPEDRALFDAVAGECQKL